MAGSTGALSWSYGRIYRYRDLTYHSARQFRSNRTGLGIGTITRTRIDTNPKGRRTMRSSSTFVLQCYRHRGIVAIQA